MIISTNWLKQFTQIDENIEDLQKMIGSRLVEVESVEYIGEKYKDILIVRVMSCENVEGSDHLHLTKIDDGGRCQIVERDENGYVQVVCGAPNIAAGQLVAWLPPESIVPETYNDSEPFKLGIRSLRGYMSNGMIASGKELAISDDHEGILVIDEEVEAGTSFSKYFELDDYLLNIENKSLTHRPDCFGIVGFAREVAAIYGKKFQTPDWLFSNIKSVLDNQSPLELNVSIENPELCYRYLSVVMSNVDGALKSPIKIQTYLSRSGVRPINAIVDVTNYLMLLTGQPLHAFDYDKVANLNNGKAEIRVRAGIENEKLELIDGRNIELSKGDIVIASGNIAIGLAGAMGGANTEIDDKTKRIIIESASFNMYNLRSTQMRHGIFSEAITRFTKGQSRELCAPVMQLAIELMQSWAKADILSDVIDIYPTRQEKNTIQMEGDFISKILGLDIELGQALNILNNAELNIEKTSDNKINVGVPYWRHDIEITEDIAEEVGRIIGFDNIKPTLPKRDFVAIKPVDFDDFRKNLRKILLQSGANEVLTYSFINGDIIGKVGQDIKNSYKIVNSISPDLQYYRQSLTPSLINLIHSNIKQGFDDFAVYEINKIHQKQDGLNDENVPCERNSLALALANSKRDSRAYYHAKYLLDYLFQKIGLKVRYEEVNSLDYAIFKPFEPKHSAKVIALETGDLIGIVGEYSKSVIKSFKLPDYSAGFEIDTEKTFHNISQNSFNYKPSSRYPITERDMCFRMESSVNYRDIIDIATAELINSGFDYEILPVDIYKPKDSGTKNITIRLKISSKDHTLSSQEISDLVKNVSDSVAEKVGATVI